MANNTKTGKLVLAVLIVWIVGFLLGWLIFGIALRDFYADNMIKYEGLDREMPMIPVMLLGNLAQSILLVYVLYLGRAETFGRGFVIGAIVTGLMGAGMDLFVYSSMNLFNGAIVIIDILVNAIFGGILGGIAGWFLGYKRAEKAETPPLG